MKNKKVTVLGCTGSIGKNTLKVIAGLKDRFKVVALATGSNVDLFSQQINKFSPKIAAIMDKNKFSYLKNRVKVRTKLLAGQEGIGAVAALGVDVVVMAIGGSAALFSLIAPPRP